MYFFRFTVGSETGRCHDIDSVISFPTGWFKLTLTFSDPDDLKVYFDDTLAIALPSSCGGTFPPDDDEMLVFGRKYIDVNTNSITKFKVDEFAFWSRILSTAEITTL